MTKDKHDFKGALEEIRSELTVGTFKDMDKSQWQRKHTKAIQAALLFTYEALNGEISEGVVKSGITAQIENHPSDNPEPVFKAMVEKLIEEIEDTDRRRLT